MMKKIIFLLPVAVLFLNACQQTPKTEPVDTMAETAAINALIDQLDTAFMDKDAATLASFLAEDLLCCGTDPSEFWSKQEVVDLWTRMFAQMDSTETLALDFISDRQIQMADDGKSAVVVEQYRMPEFTPKIPWRNVYYLVNEEGQWTIMFFSSSLIPLNEDLEKLNMAMEGEG